MSKAREFQSRTVTMMAYKIGVLLLSLIVGSFALPPQTPDDLSSFFIHTDTGARIVGGTQAAEGSAPYMVALSNGMFIRSLVCGGSIIASRYVLTAAHCIEATFAWGSLLSSLRLTVGTNRWNLGGTSYTVARNITHQHYSSDLIKNDIGLLVTNSDIWFSDTIQPVQLSFNEVGGGVPVRVAGWGRIRQGGALSTYLLELLTETISNERCKEEAAIAAVAWEALYNVKAPPVDPELEVCTFHSEGHGNCNGDSGSALVRLDNRQQVGVVSWGFPCAVGAPDMFVRVSTYREWFLTNVV